MAATVNIIALAETPPETRGPAVAVSGSGAGGWTKLRSLGPQSAELLVVWLEIFMFDLKAFPKKTRIAYYWWLHPWEGSSAQNNLLCTFDVRPPPRIRPHVCTVLHKHGCTALYCTVLYCTVLYCTPLYRLLLCHLYAVSTGERNIFKASVKREKQNNLLSFVFLRWEPTDIEIN